MSEATETKAPAPPPPPPDLPIGYGGAEEEGNSATREHLLMLLEALGDVADRVEIACQAIVYCTHEHQRLLVALGVTSDEHAADLVQNLARDLNVVTNYQEEDTHGEDGEDIP